MSLAEKLALAAEILVAYARARRLLKRRRLPEVAAAMRVAVATRPSHREGTYTVGLRLSMAVTRVLGALPQDPRCLTKALVLSALLARRGIAATLVIGVRPDPFAAHAWVEHDGQPLLPAATAPFERLLEM
jgi:hypothetical protein